jgi:hypothetical protein
MGEGKSYLRAGGSYLPVARLSANSVSMKPRHATALALVGWCLMLPPLADEVKPPIPHRTVALSASLSQWCLVQCFDTTEKCESMREDWYDDGAHKLDVLISYRGKFTLSLYGVFAELFVRCVADNDPGVKGRKVGSKCFVPPPGLAIPFPHAQDLFK